MPSGAKTVFINSRERAISTDVNRLQAFAAADRAEALRGLWNTSQGSDDFGADIDGTVDVEHSTSTTPVSGEISCGLLVRPQLGTSGNPLGLLIDKGEARVIAPDGDPDGSPYKDVVDPGVQVLGTLNMTAGGGGGTRVDIIAAHYTLNAAAETDNRDIFNPSTGLFSATTVSKATQAFFAYQVFSGAVGGGVASALAALPAGWLPLCLAVVPAAAVNNDGMTFYDVRPMISQRPVAPFKLSKVSPSITYKELAIDNNGAANAFLFGHVETDGVADETVPVAIACRLGGEFGFSVDTSPDLSTAQYQSGGAPANGPAYVYLACPFGLTNWRQYLPATAGVRLPAGVRGIPLISNTGPVSPLSRVPSAALPLPVSSGLGGSTSAAICVASTLVVGGVVQTMSSDGRFDVQGGSIVGFSQAAGVSAGGVCTFTFTPNGTTGNLGYAASAKSLRVQFELSFSVNATTNANVAPLISGENAGATQTFWKHRIGSMTWSNGIGSVQTWEVAFEVEIPVPTGNAAAWKVVVDTQVAGGATLSSGIVTINAVALN